MVLIGAGLTVASPASAQNLVTNGTFGITGGTSSFWFGGYSQWGGSESLASWTYVPSGVSPYNGAGFDFANGATSACYGSTTNCSGGSIEQILPSAITAPVGGNFLAIDADWGGSTQSSGVSQTISGLTVGATYQLSFSFALTEWYNKTGSSQGAITAILGSSQSTPTDTVASQGFSGWATETFTYVATATSETLSLLGTSGSGNPLVLVANVSLTKTPEPMTITILGSGILGLMVAARRRRAPLRRE